MKLIKCILNLLTTILIILGVALVLPKCIGIEPYLVLSGSMEPAIQTGGIVYTNTNDKEIAIGDVITYRIMEEQVTHRVIRIEDGNYITKGDNNGGEDAEPVTRSQVIGKVILSIPHAGYIANWFHTKMGIFVMIILFLMSFLMDYLDIERNIRHHSKGMKDLQHEHTIISEDLLKSASVLKNSEKKELKIRSY